MKKNIAYLLFLPGAVLLLLFMTMPLIASLLPTVFPDGLSLNGYIEFFLDPYNAKIIFRTLRISLITATICAVFGLPAAYFISRCDKRWQGFFMAVCVFPMLTNSVVRGFVWINILGKNGIINRILTGIGLIREPLKLLYTEPAIIVGTVYLFLPLMILTLMGVMENIENDMLEAAESLGASRMRGFLEVVLPLSIPGIIVGYVLVFTGALGAYTTPQLLGGSSNLVLATFIYQKTNMGDWNGAGIIAVVMIAITLIVMKLLNAVAGRLDKRGE